jgi:hypothetical protein
LRLTGSWSQIVRRGKHVNSKLGSVIINCVLFVAFAAGLFLVVEPTRPYDGWILVVSAGVIGVVRFRKGRTASLL